MRDRRNLDLVPAEIAPSLASRLVTTADWTAGPPSAARHTRWFDPPLPLVQALGYLERYRGVYHRCAVRFEDGSVLWLDRDAFVRYDPTDTGLREAGLLETSTPVAPRTEALIGPLDRSYWVRDGELVAGFYPGSEDPGEARTKIERLVYFGVRVIVNLMEKNERDREGRLFRPYVDLAGLIGGENGVDVRSVSHPIRDMGVTSAAGMRAILDTIDGAVAGGRLVYLHCWGGKGRTGTAVGCWLARHGLATGDAALARVRELRSRMPPGDAAAPSPETPEQRDMVRSWRVGE